MSHHHRNDDRYGYDDDERGERGRRGRDRDDDDDDDRRADDRRSEDRRRDDRRGDDDRRSARRPEPGWYYYGTQPPTVVTARRAPAEPEPRRSHDSAPRGYDAPASRGYQDAPRDDGYGAPAPAAQDCSWGWGDGQTIGRNFWGGALVGVGAAVLLNRWPSLKASLDQLSAAVTAQAQAARGQAEPDEDGEES